jgi:cytochrome P450
MVLYPQVQAKAQEELDRVVGSDRLPTFEDRPNLPYVNALVLEVMRWHTVAPTGFPHVSTADDIYGRWFIPKGTLIIPILWYGIPRHLRLNAS